jgi:hypothetical protein
MLRRRSARSALQRFAATSPCSVGRVRLRKRYLQLKANTSRDLLQSDVIAGAQGFFGPSMPENLGLAPGP